jgi:2-C-methyl-D-erythritol 4-phosphate cytidylyltransferase/2-C-methyl-D-erythritol 2,4-cyclodiphosphate synthase
MGVNLSGRSFLKLLDLTTEEIEYLLKLSKNFKDMKRAGVPHRYLEGKNIVLLFQKTSTRTRCAFEVGGMDLGMGVTYLDPGSSQMGKKESIEDTARVLDRFYDGIEFRGFAQSDVEELAAGASVPVWNGLTTEWHPTQMLADILTVQENFNYDIKGKTLVFMGDAANNVARSLMVVCAKLGLNFVACGPKENMPAADLVETCEAIAAACPKPCAVVQGGATRADSVRNGLAAATGELVAIHDAARPFVSESVITAALTAAAETGAAAPAVPVKDTVKVADSSGRVLDTPDRATLYAVQTPQCFRRALYTRALAAVTGEKARLVTDDCSLFELAGLPVRLTEGDYANYKITTKEDLQKEKTMRIGHGYDVHRLVEDRKLIMGGVEIPYEKGLLGHSDADVLLHAVMDAVLGAAALGDIGQHFPDNDPAYKGADSLALTREVARIIAEHGYKVGNIDATILCQRPKLAPHIPAMRRNIADAFGLPVDAVSVKATTEEHLGFTGEGLGIAAHAVALIE